MSTVNLRITKSGSLIHGSGSTALGSYAHAEGLHTVVSNDYEHAQGKYNATASSQIFSIGCGGADRFGTFYRKNAVSIITGSNPSASIYIYGVGGYDGTNPTPGTNDLATVIAGCGSDPNAFISASYDSTGKEIQFFNGAGTKVAFVDATGFIKDGMLASASVSSSYLVLTFNTDAGQEPISMSLLDIFDPSNYYTKSDLNPFTASVVALNAKSGSWDAKWNYDEATIQAVKVNSASSADEAISASYALTASFAENVVNLPLTTGSAPCAIQSTTGSVASGTASFARGLSVTASGIYSHAEGMRTEASGNYSHAEGQGTVASGYASHAEGDTTVASGDYSHAEGEFATALGTASFAHGLNVVASGDRSHAEGIWTEASGNYSHAEGLATNASGESSHAEGSSTIASGYASHAEGQNTDASNQYEHAQGQYNATASSQIFSVGCGDSNARRKNAISIITGSGTVSSASVYIYGLGGYDGTNPQPGVNDLATVISNIQTALALLGSASAYAATASASMQDARFYSSQAATNATLASTYAVQASQSAYIASQSL